MRKIHFKGNGQRKWLSNNKSTVLHPLRICETLGSNPQDYRRKQARKDHLGIGEPWEAQACDSFHFCFSNHMYRSHFIKSLYELSMWLLLISCKNSTNLLQLQAILYIHKITLKLGQFFLQIFDVFQSSFPVW